MRAADTQSPRHKNKTTPLPQRMGAALTAVLMIGLALPPTTAPVLGQGTDAGWRFTNDAFADLWFHGLAVVGFHGSGLMPLYSPEYARRVGRQRGSEPSELERSRVALLEAFQADPAFEVLHFVPLYFQGTARTEAMQALRRVADLPEGMPDIRGPARTGAAAVAAVLSLPSQRRTLAAYLDALDGEWRSVVGPRRKVSGGASTKALHDRWTGAFAPALKPFLESEGFKGATVITVPALGPEGRFLPSHPARPGAAVIALGHTADEDVSLDETLASLVRELCYPAVRRALQAFEGRLPDRVAASRVSDLAATRCGELLLEQYAPELVAAYRTRFGLDAVGPKRGFLSAAGQEATAAAMEVQLEAALRREINVNPDTGRTSNPPVGR